MASFERVRLKALQLPMVEEGDHRGGPAFKVGKKAFALWWAQGARTIMKLPKARQEFLFAVRPEVFQPCPVGVGVWSFVDLERLADAEVDALVLEAWTTIVPRALARSHIPR